MSDGREGRGRSGKADFRVAASAREREELCVHVFLVSTHRTRTRLAPSTLASRALFTSSLPARRLRRHARGGSPSSTRFLSLTSSCRPRRLAWHAPPHPRRWQPARDVWIMTWIAKTRGEGGGQDTWPATITAMGARVVRALCWSKRADAMTRISVMRAPVARGEARSLEG